jgi:hypothetical protein
MESNRMKAAAGEDCLCRRESAEPDQARDLHHQGEPHLRSDLRRPEEGRQAGGQWRPQPDHVWRDITPNLHKLALQFGVLDNFYDSGEVSGDGHVWSNAAIGTDYLEKTWQQSYRGEQRSYDYEGVVAEGCRWSRIFPT